MGELLKKLTTVEFWTGFLSVFRGLGPVLPVLLAFVESLIPPLPLMAIVTVNVAAHGAFMGFVYSWVGTALGSTVVFLFFRHLLKKWFMRFEEHHPKVSKARRWVEQTNTPSLFMVALLPFTPSSFLNFAFGVSDYPVKKYLLTICSAKLIMIALLAFIGQSAVNAFEDPLFIPLSLGLLIVTYLLSKWVMKKKM